MANQAWRLIATAFSFVCFGVGGGLIGLLVTPFLLFAPLKNRDLVGKRFIQLAFRSFIELMRMVGVLTYQVKNKELLQYDSELVLANHPTLIDVIFLLAFTKQPDCVVKQALLSNPFTCGPVKAANFILNGTENFLKSAVDSIGQGNNLVLFPEGTRSRPGKDLRFHRGAANIALQSKCRIRPVVIKCEPLTLTKNEPWYQIPKHRVHIVLSVKDCFDINPYIEMPRIAGARQLTNALETYFQQEV